MSLQELASPPAAVRTNPAQHRQAYLDSIRGIACLLVVFHHLNINLGVYPLTIWGFTGVHIFFILSGYLLSKPFVRFLLGSQTFPPLLPFYTRRFTRIYPPYFVALLVYIGLRVATHSKVPTLTDILLHVGLIFNYGQESYFLSINPAFWSLCIEAQFYLALPLLAGAVYLAGRRRCGPRAALGFVVGLYAVGILWRAGEFLLTRGTMPPGAENVSFFRMLPAYFDLFGAGVLVAALEMLPVAEKLRSRKVSSALLVTGAFVFLAANLWCSLVGFGAWITVNNLFYAVLFPVVLCFSIVLMMVPITLYFGERSRWLNAPSLVALGAISYSIYLYHIGVQFFFLKAISLERIVPDYALRNFVYLLISLLPVIAVSAVMYWLVERPCLTYLSGAKRNPRVRVPAQIGTP